MTRAFAAVNRYLGWGEPSGGVWFVGLEEADGWDGKSEAEVLEFYKDQEVSPHTETHDFAGLGAKGRDIRHKTARILSAVSSAGRSRDWRWYHDEMLWRPGTLSFQANLFPLGKPNRAEWPESFDSLFGFDSDRRSAYEEHVAKTRFPRLRELWLQSQPQCTICFGSEGWDHCRRIFNLASAPVELVRGKVYAYDPERVILTQFFAYGHMSNKDTDQVSSYLRERWNVTIP